MHRHLSSPLTVALLIWVALPACSDTGTPAKAWPTEGLASVPVCSGDNDGVVDPGENAWGYVRGLSTSSRTNIPIIFDSSDTAVKFDTGVWDGRAVVAKLDGSVEAMKIDYDGKPVNDDGSSKTEAIVEKRGATEVDIFSIEALPSGAEVLVPAKG